MAMFPIFLCGILLGGVLGYVCSLYRKEIPSNTKLESLQMKILSQEEDILLLKAINNELREELKESKK